MESLIAADMPPTDNRLQADRKGEDRARYWAGKMAAALQWPQEIHRFPGPGEARLHSAKEM